MYRAAVLLSVVGCYSPSYSNCTIACTDSCPNSLTCDTQLHVCRASGTTCGAVDASVGSDATGGMDARSDGAKDAPPDAPGGCTFVQEGGGGQDGGNLNADFSSMPITQGNLVVVAIAGRGPSTIGTVSDLNGHQFSEAIKSQVTASGTTTTSAIYYTLAAPAAMSLVNINWTGSITQTVIIGEWHCSAPPSAVSRTGMTNGASTGNATDTGMMTLPARALVVASLSTAANAGNTMVQTPGFTQIDQLVSSGTNGVSTNTTVWGVVEGGTTVDVTFSTAAGAPFAATAAAFTVQ